ncbi:hypothetical protein ABMA27_016446 [Loxostege sticticalis]|uniref:G-protein coupled receptors family 2 profile 2 domain-containing protein n=1 Tax=Loxostege sticticalis TaxID=481309 RepID=A0ABR3I2C2_LOXSC
MNSLHCFLFITTIFATGNLALDSPDICESKKCLKKCCPFGKFVYSRKKCAPFNGTEPLNISLPVFTEDFEPSKKTYEELFQLQPNAFPFENTTFRVNVYDAILMKFNVYLKESGVLFLELPNAYERWTRESTDMYCLDYAGRKQADGSLKYVFGVWASFDSQPPPKSNGFYRTGMMVSCVFLGLVLLVYLVLPELQNLGGLVLMAYVASLLCAFICLLIVQRGDLEASGCKRVSFLTYFFFIASFCWMNIMSCDIWWTFRGYAKARPIHRRGEFFKFLMYCLYAFGVSGAMTAALMVLNDADLRSLPGFVTPGIPDKGCFLEGGEKLYYLYMPMLIMIILNWLFFLMTAFNIWRLGRGTAVLDSAAAGTPAAHRQQKQRFLVYLKLSIVMGLNWLLEVVSSVTPDLLKDVWYISDTYNMLVGLAIFLIFVCKKKIFKKLYMRLLCLSSFNHYSWAPGSMRSRSNSTMTETSSISAETPLQISINPKGGQNYPKERQFF